MDGNPDDRLVCMGWHQGCDFYSLGWYPVGCDLCGRYGGDRAVRGMGRHPVYGKHCVGGYQVWHFQRMGRNLRILWWYLGCHHRQDQAKGTWYASFYYEDWTGKKVKKMKRGFPTKREALEWERTFLQQQTADLEMTFENFVAVYVADMKGRIKENTWGTKDRKSVV